MSFDLTPDVSPALAGTAVVWGLRILYAAGILAVGLWLAFFISNAVRRQAARHPRIDETLGSFFALVVRYAIIAFVVIAVLQKFGVPTASLVAALGAGALAIGPRSEARRVGKMCVSTCSVRGVPVPSKKKK